MVNSTILNNANLKEIASMGNFHVLEHEKDLSVSAYTAVNEFFASKMNVRKRQLLLDLDEKSSYIVQKGAMQWMSGNVTTDSNVKGVGDFLGKMVSSAVTNESAVKPIYRGKGQMMLEPTYRHIILVDVSKWGTIVLDDGLFLACDGTLLQKTVARRNISSAVLGGEGLFNLSLSGNGIAALESKVPYEELIEVILDNDVMKIDGNMAVAWSGSLQFTVEKSGKSLVGSAVSGEGFVNVYRGTGKILLAPTASDYANPVASSSNTSQSQSKTSSNGTLEKAGKVLGTVTDVLDLFS
ncbi:MAG: AIM24 family protein [Lachnospiraceae bacterium]|nr:AIM24 family protein [Lachnospiraceae bacterium]